jgi:hypothetical protein
MRAAGLVSQQLGVCASSARQQHFTLRVLNSLCPKLQHARAINRATHLMYNGRRSSCTPQWVTSTACGCTQLSTSRTRCVQPNAAWSPPAWRNPRLLERVFMAPT